MIDIVAGQEAERRFLHEHASHMHPQSFVDGAEWYAAGMAVCAFLDDLALQMSRPRARCDCRGASVYGPSLVLTAEYIGVAQGYIGVAQEKNKP